MSSLKEEGKGSEATPFEKAFSRLEELLELLNSEELPLEEALKRYEEAEGLLNLCHRRLGDAERRIEILLKNREGEPLEGSNAEPLKEPFIPPSSR